MNISPKMQNIRLVYCPAHQGIEGNELAYSLAKTASKKTKHLQHNTQIHPLKYNKVTKFSL